MFRHVIPLFLGAVPLAAKTDSYRLVWRDDPATTVCVQWCQTGGQNAQVCYSETDHGNDAARYEKKKPADRVQKHQEMVHHFARLTGLKPDTAYHFVIQDSDGTSRRMWFRTAPADRKPFTFTAGSDCHSNAEARRKNNRIVPLMRPLFVAFAGGYTEGDTAAEWKEFFNDWTLTMADDGRMFPLVPGRGSNEKSNTDLFNLFDVPHTEGYQALTFGGDLLRFYMLNSESEPGGPQGTWLEADLAKHYQGVRHLVAAYHQPMRPVTKERPEGSQVYRAWAPSFYRHGLDLAVEGGSHAVKRSEPVKPSSQTDAVEGFAPDPLGTVFIGEGCWGAPLRPANDLKPWIADRGSFHGFDWVHVHPDRMEVMTVQSATSRLDPPKAESSPLTPPPGIVLWDAPQTGTALTIPYRAPRPAGSVAVDLASEETVQPKADKKPKAEPQTEATTETASGLELLKPKSTWRYYDQRELPSPTWFSTEFSDAEWTSGPAPLGYGDKTVATTLEFGKDPKKKRITAWFRGGFACPDPTKFISVKGLLLRDDGARIYLNGQEVFNDNLPEGPVDANTVAPKRTPSDHNRIWVEFSFPAKLLKKGPNQIAVEIHQAAPSSEDLIFDLQLTGLPAKTESDSR